MVMWLKSSTIANYTAVINTENNPTAVQHTSPSDNKNFVIVNGDVWFTDNNNSHIIQYKTTEGGSPVVQRQIPLGFTLPDINNLYRGVTFFPYGINDSLFITFTTDRYKIGNGELKLFSDYLLPEEQITQFWVDDDDNELGDSVVFMTSLNRMFGLNVESETPVLLKEIDKDLVFVGFDGFDAQSGYGLVCYDMAREKFVMESAFDTAELIFPNNTYFTLIAYQLAILFCQKQNKDCTMLMTELQNQIDRFYDSLHRDETSFRITNVDGGYNY